VILATSDMIQLQNFIDLKYIFIMIGSLTLVIAGVLIFGIKDVHSRKLNKMATIDSQNEGIPEIESV
jgi:hypothetical protein